MKRLATAWLAVLLLLVLPDPARAATADDFGTRAFESSDYLSALAFFHEERRSPTIADRS